MRCTALPTVVLACAAIVTLLSTRDLRAEKVDMTAEELRETATHVIVGKVTAIYERKEEAGDWKYTHYVAEMKIEKSEKGDGLHAGEMAYVRYWRRQYAGKEKFPPPNTNGHRGLPVAGQKLRIYLAKNAYDGFSQNNNDGGLNVIGANGFEALPPEPKK
jgi:hypothetical protein